LPCVGAYSTVSTAHLQQQHPVGVTTAILRLLPLLVSSTRCKAPPRRGAQCDLPLAAAGLCHNSRSRTCCRAFPASILLSVTCLWLLLALAASTLFSTGH
jgi:hypothetical protein